MILNNTITINDDIIFSPDNHQDYLFIKNQVLIILIGLSGVGKSTICKSLEELEFLYFLPERRCLTDKIILDQQNCPIKEHNLSRIERFERTKAFKNEHSGGMAFILSNLQIKLDFDKKILIFDGIRGEEELVYALENFPKAFYFLFTAPDHLRLLRLVKRKDSFDQLDNYHSDLDLSLLKQIFSNSELLDLLKDIELNKIDVKELMKKTHIILKEKEHYSSLMLPDFLRKLNSDRYLIIDSSINTIEDIEFLLKKFIKTKVLKQGKTL